MDDSTLLTFAVTEPIAFFVLLAIYNLIIIYCAFWFKKVSKIGKKSGEYK